MSRDSGCLSPLSVGLSSTTTAGRSPPSPAERGYAGLHQRGRDAAWTHFRFDRVWYFHFCRIAWIAEKIVLWRIGTVQSWLRAHIWLTLLTIPLVVLHSGFRLGGPMTTLIIILYIIVMVSGIYGLVLQHYVPAVMMERLPAESVYEQIPH